MWRTGAALVANGRDADFAELVKTWDISGYVLAAMQMAGNLMAGKADKALAIVAPLTGNDHTNAVTETLEMLLYAGGWTRAARCSPIWTSRRPTAYRTVPE
jgi:hypothetical protein